MKIGSSFSAVVNPKQSKPAKESRALDTKKPGGGVEDNVDVSAQAYSSQAAPAASYGEALDLTKSIDYRKAIGDYNITKETAFQLASLMQA
jgi:hypothetical protein